MKQIILFAAALMTALYIAGCSSSSQETKEEETPVQPQIAPLPPSQPKQEDLPVSVQKNGKTWKSQKYEQSDEKPDLVSPQLPPEASVQVPVVNRLVMPDANTERFLSDSSFLMNWLVSSPFEMPADESPASFIHKEVLPDEKYADGTEVAGLVSWQKNLFDGGATPGKMDLRAFYPNLSKPTMVYLLTYVYSENDVQDISLKSGGSGYMKIWINDRLVHAWSRGFREASIDQDSIDNIKFQKGYNRIMVKALMLYPSKPWSIFIRFTGDKGLPLCTR